MGERKQINLVVDESQKDRWDAYVENSSEVSSLSHLIRQSVEREIDRDGRPGGEVEVEMSAFEEKFDTLESQIDDLAADVRTLVKERDSERLKDLAAEIYEYAEEGDPEKVKNYDEVNRDVHYTSISDLTGILNEDEYTLRQAIEQVQESFPRVKLVRADGEEYLVEVVHNGN